MKKLIANSALALYCSTIAFTEAKAQVTLSAQLRTRVEYRDGQGSPLPNDVAPAVFTSQRSRLNIYMSNPRIKFNATLQDVRVWGQDASTINRFTVQENNGLMLHEAWAEILLSDTAVNSKLFALKIGRQELIYDDQRLLGNLDWLQQGRRHDAAVIKYETPSYNFHIGGAYNQNKENASGTTYNNTPPAAYPATTNAGAMYKSMQFLYAQRKLNKGHLSFLFFTDQFNKFSQDTITGVIEKKFTKGVWARATTGVFFNKLFGNTNITTNAYYQFGVNGFGQKISAEMFNLQLLQKFGKFTIGPGIDYTSGSFGNAGRAFDPLYGTPHKFWGFMDYFYAGNGFGKGGLINAHLNTRYSPSQKITVTADLHQFSSAANTKSLGQELDLTATYNLTRDISFESGYAHYFTTSFLTSPLAKNITNAKPGANWAYVMINIKPSFFLTK